MVVVEVGQLVGDGVDLAQGELLASLVGNGGTQLLVGVEGVAVEIELLDQEAGASLRYRSPFRALGLFGLRWRRLRFQRRGLGPVDGALDRARCGQLLCPQSGGYQ